MKKLFLIFFMILSIGNLFSQNEIIQTVPPGESAMFIEFKNFSSTQEILNAIRAGKSTKIKFLYPGEQYVVLGLDKETPTLWSSYVLAERVKGEKRIKGWIFTKDIRDRTPLASSFPIDDFPAVRDEYFIAIKGKVVAPGMNKSEVFLATNIYRDAAKVENGYMTWHDIDFKSSFYFYNGELYKSIGKYGEFYYQSNVRCDLVGVECSETLSNADTTLFNQGIYKDEYVYLKWGIGQKQLSFSLRNESQSSMKIDWNEVLYIDHLNVSRRVIHKGIKLKDREVLQAPSIVARNSSINDVIVPIDNIEYDEKLKDWMLRDLFPLSSPKDETYKELINSEVRIVFPISFKDKQIEYTFVIRINDITFEYVQGNINARDVY